jgi:hypothetical protein
MSDLDTQPVSTTFWGTVAAKLKAILQWLAQHLAAPGVALLVVVGAVLLAAMGWKEVQIGGILGKLFGKKTPEQKAIAVANTPPSHRVDAEGRLIQPGTPDSKGDTQAVVVPIQNPGLFSNPNTVKYTPPGESKPVELQLPDGVRSKDVEKVIVVHPEAIVVTVKSKSGITAQKVEDLLSKYRKT